MSISKIASTCVIISMITACSTAKTNEWFVSHNGNMPSNERISQIFVGDTQAKVRDILGTPSSIISLDKNTWIYMSSDVKRVAFCAPKEVARDVLTIRFDDAGVVTEITRKNKADGKEVAINQDETEAPGERVGFFKKYFGGVGQYMPFSN